MQNNRIIQEQRLGLGLDMQVLSSILNHFTPVPKLQYLL